MPAVVIAGTLLSQPETRPIKLGRSRIEVQSAPQAHAGMFARHRAMLCNDLLEPDFLAALMDRCQRGGFVVDHVEHLGSREIELPALVGGILTLALSRPPLLRWLEAATACGPLHRADGRVVQARAGGGDALDWHDDRGDPRRCLAITINLSDGDYQGGTFELREVASRKMLATHRHDRPGSALVFEVADDIEHRVLPVTHGGPRRVYTGWFLGTARPLA